MPHAYRVFQKSSPSPHKTFWNIFISFTSFCVKFCKFVGNWYPHISTIFCRFILIFHQMALLFLWIPVVFTVSSFEYSPIKWKCSVPAFRKWRHFSSSCVFASRFVGNDLVRKPSFPVSLTKGGSWALVRKCAVESTALAQPFCVNQAVGDLPQRLHAKFVVVRQFSHW